MKDTRSQLIENGNIQAVNNIVCPYCFYSYLACEESDGAPYEDEWFTCHNCGEKFSVDCETTGDFWFTTRPIKKSKEVLKTVKSILKNQDDPHEVIKQLKKEMGIN